MILPVNTVYTPINVRADGVEDTVSTGITPNCSGRIRMQTMNILTELFILFFKLGAFTIGGGVAMLPLLQNTLIHEKKWFSEEEFVDIVAVCQSLPGVIAINMATYVGYKKKGFLGSLISTIGVVLPSFVMILLIATFISNLGDNRIVMGAMAGLRAAALGLVVVAVIQLSSTVFKGKWTIIAAVLSFVLIAVFRINTAYVILLFVILGIASALAGSRLKKNTAGEAEAAEAGMTDGRKPSEDGTEGGGR